MKSKVNMSDNIKGEWRECRRGSVKIIQTKGDEVLIFSLKQMKFVWVSRFNIYYS